VNLRARLFRAERALHERMPLDPRRDLRESDAAAARAILELLATGRAAELDDEVMAVFDAHIRPRLPQWLAFEARWERWLAGEEAIITARRKRRMHHRFGMTPSVDSPVFTENGRRYARTLLGLPADPPDAAAAP
jgi:hypothetical protein